MTVIDRERRDEALSGHLPLLFEGPAGPDRTAYLSKSLHQGTQGIIPNNQEETANLAQMAERQLYETTSCSGENDHDGGNQRLLFSPHRACVHDLKVL